ncbi:hypothetical protein Hdeb2414_s0001g00039181 [Helianthus debilis subsp. tardiflorus]
MACVPPKTTQHFMTRCVSLVDESAIQLTRTDVSVDFGAHLWYVSRPGAPSLRSCKGALPCPLTSLVCRRQYSNQS